MPVNWKEPDAFTRLLAAMVAAQDMKLDYRKIATMYGNGATYDSIEGRFRIIKKEAKDLKSEIDSGVRPEAPMRGTNTSMPKKPKTATSTPKKGDKTVGGRVGKSANSSPMKKNGGGNVVNGIKEGTGSSASSFFGGSAVGVEGEGEGDGGVGLMMDMNVNFDFDEGEEGV